MWMVIHIANVFFLLGLGTLLYKVLGQKNRRSDSLSKLFRIISKGTGILLVFLAAIFSVILVLQIFAYM